MSFIARLPSREQREYAECGREIGHLLSPTVSAAYSSSHLEVSNFHSGSR